jgi:hypothetical protein
MVADVAEEHPAERADEEADTEDGERLQQRR